MLKVGITGGIGSGKTTVCKVFELLGVGIFYADIEAKKLINENKQIKNEIINLFGNEILADSNSINRQKISELVFIDKELLLKLNSIIHPAVNRCYEEWLKTKQNQSYILKEAAILLETSASMNYDKVITVIAPQELKIQRVLKRDNLSKENILQRINNQSSDEYKISKSDFVITNDEQQLLIPQVIHIHQKLISRNEKNI